MRRDKPTVRADHQNERYVGHAERTQKSDIVVDRKACIAVDDAEVSAVTARARFDSSKPGQRVNDALLPFDGDLRIGGHSGRTYTIGGGRSRARHVPPSG